MERLRRTGLYAQVTPPRLEIVPSEHGDRPLDGRIRYDLREGATHRVEVAAGYSGESESLSGLFDLGLANLFGTGRAFDFQWERRQSARTRFLLRYREPFLWRLPFAWSVEIQHVLEDTIYTRTDLRGVVAWEIDENLWLDVGLRQERNVASAASGGGRTRTSSLFGLRWEGIGRDAAKPSGIGAEVNWSRGQTRSARPGGLRETVHEVEFKGELRASVPVLGLGRARLRAGGRFLSDPVPQFETYGIGGAATLRGYREEEFRVLRYGVAQIEAGPSLGPGGARLLFFVDGGWLLRWRKGEDALLGTKGDVSLRGAYGIGLRSLSRRGLARIDYGVAWGSDPTNGRLHVALEAPF
jgi:outer membrane protein assembly factor BamA